MKDPSTVPANNSAIFPYLSIILTTPLELIASSTKTNLRSSMPSSKILITIFSSKACSPIHRASNLALLLSTTFFCRIVSMKVRSCWANFPKRSWKSMNFNSATLRLLSICIKVLLPLARQGKSAWSLNNTLSKHGKRCSVKLQNA